MTRARAAEVEAAASAPVRGSGGRFVKGNPYTFRRGEVNNPAGRTKRKSISELTYDALQSPAPVKIRRAVAKVIGVTARDLEGLTLMEVGALQAAARQATHGDWFDRVHDRLDPKKRRVETTGADGGPVQHEVKISRDLSAQQASEVYRDVLDGGTVVDVEPIEDDDGEEDDG